VNPYAVQDHDSVTHSFSKKTTVKTAYAQPRTCTQEYIRYIFDAGLDRSTHDKDHAHHCARTYD